jgi:hypothetical protein
MGLCSFAALRTAALLIDLTRHRRISGDEPKEA